MRCVRAAWVCPIAAPPLRDGWVLIDDAGVIADVGHGPAPVDEVTSLGHVVLLPALVNAHVHLELSWLRGRVPPAPCFVDWVRALFAVRGRGTETADRPEVHAGVQAALAELRASGTGSVGEVSNSLVAVPALAASGLTGMVFHELIGFGVTDDTPVRATRALRADAARHGLPVVPAAHAPYSVSPELFRAVRSEVNASAPPVTSVHLAESPEELQLLKDGTGPWRHMLTRVGAWRDDWQAPGTGPVDYLDALGAIDPRTLVVHGTQLTGPELDRLAAHGATLVTCPRSNAWVGVGAPPVAAFFASGVPVAVGTDSLASVGDLNLFAELATLHALAPDVPPRRLLESATEAGAAALGLSARRGTLTPGREAALIAVTLPAAVADAAAVEQHLVGGIQPSQVQWA